MLTWSNCFLRCPSEDPLKGQRPSPSPDTVQKQILDQVRNELVLQSPGGTGNRLPPHERAVPSQNPRSLEVQVQERGQTQQKHHRQPPEPTQVRHRLRTAKTRRQIDRTTMADPGQPVQSQEGAQKAHDSGSTRLSNQKATATTKG